MSDPWGQRGHAIRFDWGARGGTPHRRRCPDRGRCALLHHRRRRFWWVGGPRSSLPVAGRAGSGARRRSATPRWPSGRRQVDLDHCWSLSPAGLLDGAVRRAAGAALAERVRRGRRRRGDVVAASLRNAEAVGAWIGEQDYNSVAVVAAGERWPDGSLRPALEDLLGAGRGRSTPLLRHTELAARRPRRWPRPPPHAGTRPTYRRRCVAAARRRSSCIGGRLRRRRRGRLAMHGRQPRASRSGAGPGQGFVDAGLEPSWAATRRDTCPD